MAATAASTATSVSKTTSCAASLAVAVAEGAAGGLKDSMYEVKDSLIARQKVPDELIFAPTPRDRWWTPELGWVPVVDELPLTTSVAGYKVNRWHPPPALIPTQHEAPHLFAKESFAQAGRKVLGYASVEVLQCTKLPKMMVGIVDPYVVVVAEGNAARTHAARNDRNPCWGADSPRAFRLPITCPYSVINVAVNDEDEGLAPDDPLGRVLLDLSQMHGRTVYDCWLHLQYGFHARAKGKRGSIRLRYHMDWLDERARLLAYPELPPPTFVINFKSRKALRNSLFAVQGRHRNPGDFSWRVFNSQLAELKRIHQRAARGLRAFLFWTYPVLSVAVLIGYQLIVSYPTEFIMLLPLALLAVQLSAYLLQPKPHPLQAKLTVWDMTLMLLCARSPPVIEWDPQKDASAAGATRDEDDSDEEEFEEDDEDLEGEGESEGQGADASDPVSAKDGDGGDGGVGSGAVDAPKSKAEGKAARKAIFARIKQGVNGVVGTVGGVVAVPDHLNPLKQLERAASVFQRKMSWEEEVEKLLWDVEQQVYSQLPPENEENFVLNPIAKALGPLQKQVHTLLIYVRTLQRMLSWDDRILSFQLSVVLASMVLLTFFLGELLMLLPWGRLFEGIFRLIGLALFGPHMYYLGQGWRRQAKEREKEEREFAAMGPKEKKEKLELKRQEVYQEVFARFQKEMGERAPTETEELERTVGPPLTRTSITSGEEVKLCHLLVRTRPNAAHLRFRTSPDRRRSLAYALHPSEDRPPLLDCDEDYEA